MKKMLIFCLLLLVSCASTYTPPKHYNFDKSKVYNKTFHEVWNKTVKYFSENNIPIKNIEKNSGFIASEYELSVPVSYDYIDCGNVISTDRTLVSQYSNINIIVEKVKDSTRLTINIFFRAILHLKDYRKDVDCVSNGILEKQIFDYIEK